MCLGSREPKEQYENVLGKKGRFQQPQTDQSLLKDHWTEKGPSVYSTSTSLGSTISSYINASS